MHRGFPASPARVFPCSPHFRASTCSEAFVPSLPRSCVYWSLLLWSCFGLPRSSRSVRAPSLCTNLSWTLRCCLEHLYPLLDHTLLLFLCLCRPLEARFQRRVQWLLANIPIARPCRRSCVCSSEPCLSATPRATPVRRRLLARLLRSFSTWFRRVLTSPSLHRESILRTSLFTASLTCRRRLTRAAQTFCHLRDAWLVLLSRRNVLLVRDLVLRPVDGEFGVELGTVRVPLEMSSQQLLVCELSPWTARHCWSMAKIMGPILLEIRTVLLGCTLRQ